MADTPNSELELACIRGRPWAAKSRLSSDSSQKTSPRWRFRGAGKRRRQWCRYRSSSRVSLSPTRPSCKYWRARPLGRRSRRFLSRGKSISDFRALRRQLWTCRPPTSTIPRFGGFSFGAYSSQFLPLGDQPLRSPRRRTPSTSHRLSRSRWLSLCNKRRDSRQSSLGTPSGYSSLLHPFLTRMTNSSLRCAPQWRSAFCKRCQLRMASRSRRRSSF